MKKAETNLKNIFKKVENFFYPFYKSNELKLIFNILKKDQPKNKKIAMFVGGCVRKYILKENIDDIDIASIFTPVEIQNKFKNTEVKVIETGVEHGTVTLLLRGKKFELTTLRKDNKTDGRYAEVSFIDDWNQDSKRRDFTINAIYMDDCGKIYDPQNGVKDLKNGKVKFIGDPDSRIKEDYLRIIRYLRFSFQYDSTTDDFTLEKIKLNLNGVKHLSKERVYNELVKILRLKNFINILKHKNKKEIFSIIFPEFKEIDLLGKLNLTTNKTVMNLDLNLKLAIMLIDETNNHEYLCHKYKVPNTTKNKLNNFFNLYKKLNSDTNFFKKNIKKNIYIFGKVIMKDLAVFMYFKNNKSSQKDLNVLREKIEKAEIPIFPYNGDFLKTKGLEEGKNFGKILKKLEEEWLNNNYRLNEDKIVSVIKQFN